MRPADQCVSQTHALNFCLLVSVTADIAAKPTQRGLPGGGGGTAMPSSLRSLAGTLLPLGCYMAVPALMLLYPLLVSSNSLPPWTFMIAGLRLPYPTVHSDGSDILQYLKYITPLSSVLKRCSQRT